MTPILIIMDHHRFKGFLPPPPLSLTPMFQSRAWSRLSGSRGSRRPSRTCGRPTSTSRATSRPSRGGGRRSGGRRGTAASRPQRWLPRSHQNHTIPLKSPCTRSSLLTPCCRGNSLKMAQKYLNYLCEYYIRSFI